VAADNDNLPLPRLCGHGNRRGKAEQRSPADADPADADHKVANRFIIA
jgi:hypothetical protein